MAAPFSPRTKRLLIPVHRWAGIVAGVFLLAIGMSGLVIQWDDEIVKLGFERGTWVTSVDCDPCALARAADRVIATAPGDVVTLSLSRPDVANTGIEAAVSYRQGDGALVDRVVAVDPATYAVRGWEGRDLAGRRLVEWIYELHFSLLLGLAGSIFAIAIGAALTMLASTGMILWWPHTGRFSKALRPVPRLKGVNWLYDRHRLIGAYASALVLVIAITGVVMSVQVSLALSAPQPPPTSGARPSLPVSPAAAEAIALRTWPRAEYSGLTLPSADNPSYDVQFRWPGEPTAHVGRSWLNVDGRSGAVTARYVQPDASWTQRLLDLMIPLHSGEIVGMPGRLLNMATGVALLFLLATGIIRWWRRRKPRPAASARPAGPEKHHDEDRR